jgi:antitoxin MazE
MVLRIEKWGKSQGIRLPKSVLAAAGMSAGDSVRLTAQKGQITIRKASKSKFDLAEMVSRMPRDHKPQEQSFGKPMGNEEW